MLFYEKSVYSFVYHFNIKYGLSVRIIITIKGQNWSDARADKKFLILNQNNYSEIEIRSNLIGDFIG